MLKFDNIFYLKFLSVQIKGESYNGRNINAGLIGYKFLSKLHTFALRSLLFFFDLGVESVLKEICSIEDDNKKAAQFVALERRWVKI